MYLRVAGMGWGLFASTAINRHCSFSGMYFLDGANMLWMRKYENDVRFAFTGFFTENYENTKSHLVVAYMIIINLSGLRNMSQNNTPINVLLSVK